MSAGDIPQDKAELLSMILEALLYGFSLPLFGGTVWALLSRRSTHQINYKMITVACLLLVCSTVHLVIRTMRIADGLASYRDIFPGGPVGYFSDVSQWTFVSKNYVYTAQTLIGDGVVLYRCHAVWQSKLVTILPMLLWCVVVATGIAAPYSESRATQGGVFDGSVSIWIKSFWASTLITNLLTTLLLAYRIWRVDRRTTSSLGPRRSQLRPVLHIVIDAGMIYSFTLSAALICFVNRSNGQYVILDMITPIIAITFYMVIIRVGLANRASQTMTTASQPPEGTTAVANVSVVDRRSRVQVHVTTLVEGELAHDPHSLASPRTYKFETSRRSEIAFEDVRGGV